MFAVLVPGMRANETQVFVFLRERETERQRERDRERERQRKMLYWVCVRERKRVIEEALYH